MPQRLSETANRIVGTKQVIKHLRQNKLATVYLAGDIDDTVRRMLELAIDGQPLEIVGVPTMEELGAACGIEVGAACAALLK